MPSNPRRKDSARCWPSWTTLKLKEDRHSPETLTDEQFGFLGIQLFDLDLKTGETSPSVTQYFLPAKERWTLSNSASPIDDNFTQYNKSNTKRICRDSGWSNYLASAFCNHAESQEHNVFASPWKQLMGVFRVSRRKSILRDGYADKNAFSSTGVASTPREEDCTI